MTHSWLVYRDETAYREAVDLCALTPLDFGDAKFLRGAARAVLEHPELPELEPPRWVIALDAAVEAVRVLRRARLTRSGQKRARWSA